MSIAGFPDNYFENRWGTVLVRQNLSTGVWSFVSWAPQNGAFIESLAPGNYAYQIWMVAGYQNSATTLRSTGTARLATVGAKR